MIQIDTENIIHLEQFFDEQATKDQSSIIIQSFRKAVQPLVRTAKANAPVGKARMVSYWATRGQWVGDIKVKRRMKASYYYRGGNLQGSIGTMELKDDLAILVGAFRPRGAHAHLIEDGTAGRSYRTKNGKVKSTGRITASHFFERAYEATKDQIFDSTAAQWYAQIRRAVDKANKKMT